MPSHHNIIPKISVNGASTIMSLDPGIMENRKAAWRDEALVERLPPFLTKTACNNITTMYRN
jgi:hypothetical protein